MSIRVTRRSSGQLLRGAIALAFLLSLPIACDEEGTSPDPEANELPDTVGTGTIEVEDLIVPAGAVVVVEGDAVVIAENSIRILGDVVIGPQGSLVLVANDMVEVTGRIGRDTTASPAGSPQASPSGTMAVAPGVVAIGGNRVRVDDRIEGSEVHITTLGENGVITIAGEIAGSDGANSSQRFAPGEPGGDVEIGTAAGDFWTEIGIAGLSTTSTIEFVGTSSEVRGGRGGNGFHDGIGVAEGRTRIVTGSGGGRGGHVHLRATSVSGAFYAIHGGTGGHGGWCGLPGGTDHVQTFEGGTPVQGLDGAALLEPGESIRCFTGAGGDGGAVVVEATLTGSVQQGLPGRPGSAYLEAGQGAEGGAGGGIEVIMEVGGLFPFQERERFGGMVLVLGGNFSGVGGDSNTPGVAGGPGGDIVVSGVDGGQAQLDEPIRITASGGFASRGGAGFDGCAVDPFVSGTSGGAGGNLRVFGAPYTLEGDRIGESFDGGNGGHGDPAAAGGSGGADDAGNGIGQPGNGGVDCNDKPVLSLLTPMPPVHMTPMAAITIVVTGESFADGCVILLDTTELATECTPPGTATAEIPPALQTQGSHSVNVRNQDPGGGDGNALPYEILNPEPKVESVTPNVITGGAGSPVLITVDGQDFVDGSTILLDETEVATTFVSTNRLEATVQPEELVAGDHSVSVFTPGGGGSSASLPLTVENPAPTITGLSSISVLEDSPGFEMTITGNQFLPGSIVQWDASVLSLVSQTSTQLIVVVTSDRLESPGIVTIAVVNPGPGGGFAGDHFEVVDPVPVLTAIGVQGAEAGSDEVILALTASNLGTLYGVHWKGEDGKITFLNEVTGSPGRRIVPAELLALPGDAVVWISNAQYRGQLGDMFEGYWASEEQPFTITAELPTISSISVSEDETGSAIIVDGTGYFPDLSVVQVDGADRTTTFVSSTELRAEATASDGVPGTKQVTVHTAGVGTSAPTTLTIDHPVSTVTGADPSVFSISDDPKTVNLTGTDFSPGDCTAYMNGEPLETECTSATEASVIVPVSSQVAGPAEFCMETGPPGGGLSEECAHATIFNRPAELLSLGQTEVVAGEATDLIVNANYVVEGTVVLLDGEEQPTTVNGPTQATAHIAATAIQSAGEQQVSLRTSDGVQSTSSLPLAINNPVPLINGLSKTAVLKDSPGFDLLVNGSRFLPSTSILWNGAALPVVVSGDQGYMIVSISADKLTSPGIVDIAAVNPGPGGGFSAVHFEVVDPVPVLTDIAPQGAEAGSAEVILTLTRNNLGTIYGVYWEGEDGEIAFLDAVSGSPERRIVPAGLLALPGDAVVWISNSKYTGQLGTEFLGGWASEEKPFTITAELPTISSIAVSEDESGSAIIVNGTGYFPDLSIVQVDGEDRTTTFLSTTQLRGEATASDLEPGPKQITVHTEGVGTSEPSRLFVPYPQPVLTSTDPPEVTVGSDDLTMRVFGDYTDVDYTFTVDGVLVDVVGGGDGYRDVHIPAAQLATEHTAVITAVPTAEITVGPPGQIHFEVVAAAELPTISSVAVSEDETGSAIVVEGTGYFPDLSVVQVDGEDRITTFVSSTQLRGEATASDVAPGSTKQITVHTEGVGTSEAVTLTNDNIRPVVTDLTPGGALAGDPTFTLTVFGSGFLEPVTGIGPLPGSIVFFNGVPLTTTFVSMTELTAVVDASFIETPGTYPVTVENPGPPADNFSGPVDFEVHPHPDDPCTTSMPIPYGETVDGTLGEDGCRVEFGSNWEYVDHLAVVTTELVSTITFTAERGSVRVLQDGVGGGSVFAGGSPRLVIAPDNSPFEVVVSSGSGTPSESTYSLDIGPAASADIAGCRSGAPLGFAPFDLSGQTIEGTDCSRFAELDGAAGPAGAAGRPASGPAVGTTIRADEISLGWPAGQRVRVTMESSDFDPIVHLRCSGPSCPQVHYPGTAGAGISIVEVTNPGGVGFILWLGAPFGESGAYTATVELNPEPLAGCDPSPITLGSAHAGSITSNDCPGAVADQYFDLLDVSGADLGDDTFYERLVITSPSRVAVRVGDDFPFPRAVFDVTGTATVDFLSKDFEHTVFPFRLLSDPTQVIDYSVQSQQLAGSEWSNTGCATVWIDPDITVTQQLAADDCSRAGDKREERYLVYVQAGQTLRADVASTAFDAYVEFFDSSGTLLGSNDNVSSGTNAGLFYRPTTNIVITVVISGADTNLGEHTTRIWFP